MLICPDCQTTGDLTADLDHCRQCGSVRLVRRLGEVECRACGSVVPPDAGPVELADTTPAGLGAAPGGGVLTAANGLGGELAGAADPGRAPGLAEEVSEALERVFGRTGTKPPASAVAP